MKTKQERLDELDLLSVIFNQKSFENSSDRVKKLNEEVLDILEDKKQKIKKEV